MDVFSFYRFIFLLACINSWKIYNRLISACTLKTAIEVFWVGTHKRWTKKSNKCVVFASQNFRLAKTALLLDFFVSHLLFVHVRRNYSGNLAFRTTIIEDTHLTLAAISFKVEANNSLFFCHYKHTRKNLPS